MSLKANASMTFVGYGVGNDGITLNFVCAQPGAGEPTDYLVFFTDTELTAISTQPQLAAAVRAKLERKYRLTNIASKLDAFIGQSLTI